MHRILTIFDTIWTTVQIPTVPSCSDLGQKSHFMCYASDWSWCWSVLARRSHLRWDLLETTARGYDESGTHELVTSAASPQKNSVPWCVCVCVFVDLTSASLFWSILVLFPHKLSLIFQTPGTSNGIKPYHISHSAGGWGAAIPNRVTVHSSNRRAPRCLHFWSPLHVFIVIGLTHSPTHTLSQSQTRSYDHRTSSNYHHQYPNPKKVCIIQPVPMEVTHTLFEQSQFSKWLG